MYILGIESSCDETAAAVACFEGSEKRVLSDIVASQIDIHKKYGGVVPEIASRAHTEALTRITKQALEQAKIALSDLSAIAVTNRPGLIGALLTGVNFAKSLAFSNGIPLVPVDHIKAHISAVYFENQSLSPPFLALVVSGGHTSLIDVRGYTEFITLGRTLDDAAGETFDKIARVMSLSYPGGREMDALAKQGYENAYKFPLPSIAGTLDFSFSGLKTAVINTLNTIKQKNESYKKEDIAASFTKVFTQSIVKNLGDAIEKTGYKKFVASGGVAANSHLRKALASECEKRNVKLFMPSAKLCGDNGSMVCAQGYYEFTAGKSADTTLTAYAGDE